MVIFTCFLFWNNAGIDNIFTENVLRVGSLRFSEIFLTSPYPFLVSVTCLFAYITIAVHSLFSRVVKLCGLIRFAIEMEQVLLSPFLSPQGGNTRSL